MVSTASGRNKTSASGHDHALACMEVWGGNEAVQETISVPGIDAWICSRPFEGDRCGGE